MNLKAVSVMSATVVLSTVVGITAFSSSAQAFTLTGENTLALSGRAKFDTKTGKLDFRDLTTNGNKGYGTPTGLASITTSSSGRFENLINRVATLKDITLTSQGGDVWEYTGSTLPNFITVDTLGFSLSVFRLVKTNSDWMANVEGQFQDTALPAFGEFDPLNDVDFVKASNGSSYSFDIEEVPTPALLPGLIGLGVAALRRKNEEAEENA
ncbi:MULTISPECIES: PTPA-CTERM sorting domain-containing protein [Cyanophyceae]|uniref:PTPA-CTERM sorting domain-containing protein n=1 Tax=Leptolyngbya subtilissima DQ-A4 TaxID=2933933 RepID=A0ABV0JZ48_9CYAN|nr:PTPA-CTERM sorting domain-containing protein [Nodosilinea sp. FACHB-141]MBD2112376.1 PTPA-CTERM sorting domain-containing protein [Nodosilinea sp. FACHB-141]